jgi:competence protein ComEC
MKLMLESSVWMAGLPGAFFFIRAPSALEFALFYAISFGLLNGWLFAPDRLRWTGPALGLLILVWGAQLEAKRREQQLTILALGGGDALRFKGAHGGTDLLIDCGNALAADRIVGPFIQGQGRNRIGACLLTHGDARHSGGASNILQTLKPSSVYTSPMSFRSPEYRRLQRELDPAKRRSISRGDRVGPWEVIHPAATDAFSVADDKAVVLRGRLCGLTVLLCSDLGRAGQRALLQREPDLRADVVVTGIPTNGEPLTDALLEAVQPQAAILSTGLNSPLEQAKSALRSRLGQKPFRVCYTADIQSVTLSVRPNRAELRLMDGTRIPLRPSQSRGR